MRQAIDTLFQALWSDYIAITPSALKVHELLQTSSTIVNDHIALRTLNIPSVGLPKLSQHFESLGYVASGDYTFEKKNLIAKHFEHPTEQAPKVFISELVVDAFSEPAKKIMANMAQQITEDILKENKFLYSGRHWSLDFDTYRTLLAESEYAAWLYIWGYRVNHFTVSVNHLADYQNLSEVNQRLKDAGFRLNTAGGEIKGSIEVGLEQSSTLADQIEVDFSGQKHTIPSCFYEFALRHPVGDGGLYQGFVTASADKIFESTDAQSQGKG
mgnify:CR=1 FL=1|tara:strand:- start:2517 stop:3329 length:813 start_codon:yes stop_codon:yes gene_type:complete